MAFDPLDGSSIVDTNFSVGTIFGVWPGDKLTGITGRDQAAAGMGIYGPRTVFCIALKDAPGCHEFLLQVRGNRSGRLVLRRLWGWLGVSRPAVYRWRCCVPWNPTLLPFGARVKGQARAIMLCASHVTTSCCRFCRPWLRRSAPSRCAAGRRQVASRQGDREHRRGQDVLPRQPARHL